jgi:hypothetical protein
MQSARQRSPPSGLRLPQAELSRKSNYIVPGRIRRFESYMPSQAVHLKRVPRCPQYPRRANEPDWERVLPSPYRGRTKSVMLMSCCGSPPPTVECPVQFITTACSPARAAQAERRPQLIGPDDERVSRSGSTASRPSGAYAGVAVEDVSPSFVTAAYCLHFCASAAPSAPPR